MYLKVDDESTSTMRSFHLIDNTNYIDDVVQACTISSALAMEILQSCIKRSLWHIRQLQHLFEELINYSEVPQMLLELVIHFCSSENGVENGKIWNIFIWMKHLIQISLNFYCHGGLASIVRPTFGALNSVTLKLIYPLWFDASGIDKDSPVCFWQVNGGVEISIQRRLLDFTFWPTFV